MITKKQNAKPRQFKGVSFDVLAVGEKSMVAKINYKVGSKMPLHSHPNLEVGLERCGGINVAVRN